MQDLSRRSIAEGIGTFFLVFVGTGTATVDVTFGGAGQVGIALAFAFVVLAMIYAVGHLSGAHINPAVSIGMWSSGHLPARDTGAYVVAQCIGALAASTSLSWVIGPRAAAGATVPQIGLGEAFLVEWLLSFALMFVIMAVATDERVDGGFAGLAVGLTVGFAALMGGPLTGASMNPARSWGPAVVGGIWTAHWLYWVAPISAMIVAARTYEFLRPAGAGSVPPGVPLGVEGPLERSAAA